MMFLRRIFKTFGFDRSRPAQSSRDSDVLLSKSKYLIGLQCPKALWIHYNDKALVPPVDAGTTALFDQGHQVGLLAQKLFPDGIYIGNGNDFDQSIKTTQAALSTNRPLFEPAFAYGRCFSRADILDPVGDGRWDIVEVKSSTEPKPVYFHDLAFQWYVCEGAGLTIRNCYLLHVNRGYVRCGAIDPAAFFTKINVTQDVAELIPGVEAKVEEMLRVIALRDCPNVRISPHCNDPYECALKPVCWNFLPQPNIFQLRNGRNKRWELFDRGVMRLEDIPEDFVLSENQAVQIASHRSRTPHIDRQAIGDFLGRLQYPLYFLDFETIAPAIPHFDRSRPYDQIPFQFSLHVMAAPAAEPQHFGFLADGAADPRPQFLAELKSLLGEHGSITGYNTDFEAARLSECAGFFPEYQNWCDAVRMRLVDLLEVFEGFSYYHPSQNGGASLKAVLPVMTGASYIGLQIHEGGTASREFMRITFSDVAADERAKVRRDLETYCKQDTQALIDILAALQRL